MKKFLLLALLSLTVFSCDRNENANSTNGRNNDNTEKNVRDRDSMAKTPMDQAENEGDRTITQRIRQAIIADNSLSTNAKNVKIITVNGVVTLRGPVKNAQEKTDIAQKVNDVQGVTRVDNFLELTNDNTNN